MPRKLHTTDVVKLQPKPLAQQLVDLLTENTQSAEFQLSQTIDGPVFIVGRNGGKRIFAKWFYEANFTESLITAFDELTELYGAAWGNSLTSIECSLAHHYREVKSVTKLPNNIDRGRVGISFKYQDKSFAYVPMEMIARNLSFNKACEKFLEAQGKNPQDSAKLMGEVQVQLFDAYQAIILLDGTPRIAPVFRGNQVVEGVVNSRNTVEHMAQLMTDWMANHVAEDGRLMYKYWPSQGKESDAINLIRYFMGTVCLFKTATFYGDENLTELAQRNLAYNFSQFYVDEAKYGYVLEGEKVKLGAVALAALAAREDTTGSESYAAHEAQLHRLIIQLQQENGAFKTFLKPDYRNDCQNFYPGEAQLYWVTRYAETRDEALMANIMQSFDYYKNWHREQPNPAFVPWHTQAYYTLWQITKDDALKDFIFEMNDWLLPVQQWDNMRDGDTKGRFHDPKRPFGPPHSSSTGVYLEGLADAYALAVELEDKVRAESYKVAIHRGLRSVLQLMYVDDVDMYYIGNKVRAKGGVRTTVYDNTIRVDNVQHNLMALFKLLKLNGVFDT